MYPATILSWALLSTAPPSQPSFDISRVELERGSDAVSMFAYDDAGEVVAEFSVWLVEGDPQIAANFADGLYLFAEVDGDDVTIECSEVGCSDEVVARLAVVEDLLADTETTDGGWKCNLHVAITIYHCATLNFLGCGLGAVASVCECSEEVAC